MIETLIGMAALVGGLCLAFSLLAIVSDYLIPALARKQGRPARRPAARYCR